MKKENKKIKEFLEEIDPNQLIDRGRAESLLSDLLTPIKKIFLREGFLKKLLSSLIVSFIVGFIIVYTSRFYNLNWSWYIIIISFPSLITSILLGILFKDRLIAGISSASGISSGIYITSYFFNASPGFPNFLSNIAFIYLFAMYGGAISMFLSSSVAGKIMNEFSHKSFIIESNLEDITNIHEIFEVFGELSDVIKEEEKLKINLKLFKKISKRLFPVRRTREDIETALFFCKLNNGRVESHIFSYIIKNDRSYKDEETEKIVTNVYNFIDNFFDISENIDYKYFDEAKIFAFERHKGMDIQFLTKGKAVTVSIVAILVFLIAYKWNVIASFCDAHPWLAGPIITAIITIPSTYYISKKRWGGKNSARERQKRDRHIINIYYWFNSIGVLYIFFTMLFKKRIYRF